VRLVFFIGDMYQGGAERQLVHICNGLSSKGHEVTLLTLRSGDAYCSLLSSSVHREILAFNSSLALLPALLEFLRSYRPDIMVNFLFHAALLGRMASRMTGVPCITSHRNVSYGRPLRDILIRLTGGLDRVAVTNVAAASTALKPYFGRVQSRVIGNTYDATPSEDAAFLPSTPARDEMPVFRWCFIGRLEKQKNLPALLSAFKKIKSSGEQAVLLDIAGSGSEKEALATLIAELELEDDVTLHGQLKSTAPLLSVADALILPSLWEGMPNVLMEAMASGLPCVATPVGAVPEMLQEGRGILADGRDPDAIARAMQVAMSLTVPERQEMGRHAKAYIEKECSPEVVIDRWEQLLLSVAKE